MENKFVLEVHKYINPSTRSLVGRPAGEDLLKKLKKANIIFQELEKEYETIHIIIPKRIIVLNKSFFLGWLETRVQTLGKKKFTDKYKFEADDFVLLRINDVYIDAALLNLKPEIILHS